MSDSTLAAGLLDHAAVTALVGGRRALSRLPQGTGLPAVVYRITSLPVPPINASFGPQLMRSRLSTVTLAEKPADVDALRAAVRTALDLRSGLVAGHQVVSSIRDFGTEIDFDDDAGVWLATTDYIVHWFD
jgi:hypothetical protein